MNSIGRKKNDASALYINDAMRITDTSYKAHIVFGQTLEGLTTEDLGLAIMRYYYNYHCTYIVLDTNGLGLGVFDSITKDQYDPETGQTYKALTCCNNDEMAQRCKVRDAKKVVYSVKATADFNQMVYVFLRNAIRNGNIDFLIPEAQAEIQMVKDYKGYKKLSLYERGELLQSYAETTAAIYELVKLRGYYKDGKLKVHETSGNRKDRYSSLSYNYWCMKQLELGLKPTDSDINHLFKSLTIRRGHTSSGRKI